MKEKLKKMTVAELQARQNELKKIGENPENRSTEELEQLAEERAAIDEELAERRAAAAREQLRRDQVAGTVGLNVLATQPAQQERRTYDAGSKEYRSAFLKTLKGVELDQEERAAYVATTGDTTPGNHGAGLLIPTEMLNNIWNLIEEQHAILGDITLYRTNTYLSIPVHTAIAQGDATTVAENAANDDEINNFITVTLHGVDYSKTVKISYAMAKMSIDALEDYLTNEIAERLGAAMDDFFAACDAAGRSGGHRGSSDLPA